MKLMSRKITKEQYEGGVNNAGYLTKQDEMTVFSEAERLGYGVYGGSVEKKGEEYYVNFFLGSTCD